MWLCVDGTQIIWQTLPYLVLLAAICGLMVTTGEKLQLYNWEALLLKPGKGVPCWMDTSSTEGWTAVVVDVVCWKVVCDTIAKGGTLTESFPTLTKSVPRFTYSSVGVVGLIGALGTTGGGTWMAGCVENPPLRFPKEMHVAENCVIS